jgi:signal peptidase I
LNTSATRGRTQPEGDIVILLDGKVPVIKRIVGLPGDTVSMKLGYVFLNGKQFDEAYIPDKVQTASDRKGPRLSAGLGEYIVMGDNRPISRDNQAFGPVPRKLIQGRIN